MIFAMYRIWSIMQNELHLELKTTFVLNFERIQGTWWLKNGRMEEKVAARRHLEEEALSIHCLLVALAYNWFPSRRSTIVMSIG